MGLYDTVYVPCPKCGTEHDFQSKSGPCQLNEYTLDTAPPDVLQNVNRHAPATCRTCGMKYHVEFTVVVTSARAAKWVPYDDDD